MVAIHSPFQRLLTLPARTWRHATGRARTFAVGLALFAAAEVGAIAGMPRAIALAVFTAGGLTAATATRPNWGRP